VLKPSLRKSDMVEPNEYKKAIGAFATGVTVIVTGELGNEYAMTANAITSLSLNPVLLLVCIGKETNMIDHIRSHDVFSVNILKEDQVDYSTYFAGFWPSQEPLPDFSFAEFGEVPILENCLAHLVCDVYKVYDGGDHHIVIGEVRELTPPADDASPLIYYRASYHQLAGD